MSINTELLNTVIATAAQHGLDQGQLAKKASIRPETISRAKKRGTIDLMTLQRLAQATELELTLRPVGGTGAIPNSPLAQPRFGLAWSNPNASAQALVSNAIKKGHYHLLLEAAAAHGLAFVHEQLHAMAPALAPRSMQEVLRKLSNIEKGFSHAQA